MARGLRRIQCKACKKTFNAATGTALQGLHKRDRWLTFEDCLADGLTVRESAERCNFAVSTSFRWRHRFLGTQTLSRHRNRRSMYTIRELNQI